MSVDCVVADDNPLLDFISIKNLNLNLDTPNTNVAACHKQLMWFVVSW
jgi:hypothetical protein